MGRVAGVINDPPGFSNTPPGVDVLEGGKLTSNNVAGNLHDPLVELCDCRALRLPVVLFPNQAVMQPVRMLSKVQV